MVRRIFAEFGDSYHRFTLSEIARALNVDEAATQHGKRWHASTVRYILTNAAYAETGVIDSVTFNGTSPTATAAGRGRLPSHQAKKQHGDDHELLPASDCPQGL